MLPIMEYPNGDAERSSSLCVTAMGLNGLFQPMKSMTDPRGGMQSVGFASPIHLER